MDSDLDRATAELGRALTEWRSTHRAPARIPQEIWSRAAELAAHQGICKTARALGLGYNALKKHMFTAVEPVNATFVEWLSPMGANVRECSLTIESSRGAKMRVDLKDLAPTSIATIIREFAN